MKFPTQCPNCGSAATRSRSVVYKSGTSNYSGRNSSGGLSFGSKKFNPRFWFGSGSHSGTRQSILAREAGPITAVPSLGLLIFGFILFRENFYPVAIFLVIVWFFIAFYLNNKKYSKEWVCSKCGCFFDPEKIFLNYSLNRSNIISEELVRLSYSIYYPNTEDERSESLEKADILLREAENYNIINTSENLSKLRNDIDLINKLKYTIILLEKSDKSFLSKDRKSEVEYLLEALHSLIKIQITNEIFDSFRFVSAVTKKRWTVKYLKKRIVDAGYIPEKSNL